MSIPHILEITYLTATFLDHKTTITIKCICSLHAHFCFVNYLRFFSFKYIHHIYKRPPGFQNIGVFHEYLTSSSVLFWVLLL